MKLRKIVLMPLLLVALVSCGGGGNNGSQSGNTSSSTPKGTPVAREVANASVVAAIEKTANESITSIDLKAVVDATASRKLSLESGEVLETNSVEASAEGTVKGKDLDKGTAEFAITGAAEVKVFADDQKILGMDAEAGVYLTGGFGYTDISLSQFDGESGQTVTNAQKIKSEVDEFPGLDNLIEDLVGEVDSDLLEELNDFSFVGDVLSEIETITAVESKDKVLTVKYEIKTTDVVPILLVVAGPGIDEEGLTSEEIEERVSELQEMIDEVATVRKAEITVVVDEAGYLSGLTVDLDADVEIETNELDETSEDTIVHIQSISVKGKVALDFKINKPVTIKYPDFTDYVLIENYPPSASVSSDFYN